MIETYILKNSYPSLVGIEIGDTVTREVGHVFYTDKHSRQYRPNEIEGNDFWAKKKTILFTTEDGVDILPRVPYEITLVDKNFNKITIGIRWASLDAYLKGYVYFAHESNADRYIEKNKHTPLIIIF